MRGTVLIYRIGRLRQTRCASITWCRLARGQLGPAGNKPARDSIASSGKNSKLTAGIPLLTSSKAAHLNMPLKLDLSRVPENVALLFQLKPLRQTMYILRTPELTLRIESSRPQLQLIAYLYEATEEGSARLITHGPMTRHLVIPNKPFKTSFEMITSCYEIPKGHWLALIVDTGDLQYKQPTRDDFDVTFPYDETGAAALDIPMAPASKRSK